jgi:hypothetical protein
LAVQVPFSDLAERYNSTGENSDDTAHLASFIHRATDKNSRGGVRIERNVER